MTASAWRWIAFAAAGILPALAARGQVVINEVYYDTVGPVASKPFIELYNKGPDTAYLDGMVLGDEAGNGIEGLFRFPGSGTNHPVAPGAYVVIAADADGTDTNYPDLSALAQWECYAGSGDFDNPSVSNLTRISGILDLSLYSGGDNVLLATGSDTSAPIDKATIVDGMNISGGGGELVPVSSVYDDENSSAVSGFGFSLSRCPDGNDSDVASALDFIAAAPSPGSANPGGCPPFAVVRDFSQPEGSSGSSTALFTIVLSYAPTATAEVAYSTSNGTALAGSDYVAATGTVSFAPGIRTQEVAVTIIADTDVEPHEWMALALTAVTNVTIARPLPAVTLLNDDSPGITINDVNVFEGQAGTTSANFIVTLPVPSTNLVSVQAQTSNGTALAGSDYIAQSTTLLFQAGSLTRTVTVVVLSDTNVEPNETFFVNLSNPTNAAVADAQGLGTIINDDFTPAIALQKTVYTGHNGGASCPGLESVSGTNGAPVTYCFTVINAGGVTLTNVSVSDATLGIGPLSAGTIASGQTATVFANAFISGSLTNTATATGYSQADGTAVTNSDTAAVIQIAAPAPAVALQKTVYTGHNGGASCPGLESVNGTNGAPVTYCFTVLNTGNTLLTNVVVTDPSLGIAPIPVGSIASGLTATVHTQVFISGSLTNVALVSAQFGATTVTNTDTASAVQTLPPSPAVALQKTVYTGHDGGASCPGLEQVSGSSGSPVTYCFTVLNTGNTLLTNVFVTDATLGIAPIPVGSIASGLTATVHTQVFIGSSLTNLAVVSAQFGATTVTNSDTAAVVALTGAPPCGVFEVIDLGTLGGTFSDAYGINDTGQVVGASTDTGGVQRAFLWEDGVMTRILTNNPEFTVATAYDINSRGVIAGHASRTSGPSRGFVFSNGVVTVQEPPEVAGNTYSATLGISDKGQVCGYASTNNNFGNTIHPIFYTNGFGFDFNTFEFSGGSGLAWKLNSNGWCVGQAHAFSGGALGMPQDIWRPYIFYDRNGNGVRDYGDMQQLGTLNNGWDGDARDINEFGDVVGWSMTSNRLRFNAFLVRPQGDVWDLPDDNNLTTTNSLMKNLGTLGGTNSAANAINEGLDIVGYSEISNGQKRAFFYRDGVMTDLNTFLCTNSPWVLQEARDINNSGQIVGYGTISGQTHAFLINITTTRTEFIRTELRTNATGQIGIYWRALGSNLAFVVDGSDSLIAPNWAPLSPTNQWPQFPPFWYGSEGSVTARFFRVRGIPQP